MFQELTDELLDLQATRKRVGLARAAMTVMLCCTSSSCKKA